MSISKQYPTGVDARLFEGPPAWDPLSGEALEEVDASSILFTEEGQAVPLLGIVGYLAHSMSFTKRVISGVIELNVGTRHFRQWRRRSGPLRGGIQRWQGATLYLEVVYQDDTIRRDWLRINQVWEHPVSLRVEETVVESVTFTAHSLQLILRESVVYDGEALRWMVDQGAFEVAGLAPQREVEVPAVVEGVRPDGTLEVRVLSSGKVWEVRLAHVLLPEQAVGVVPEGTDVAAFQVQAVLEMETWVGRSVMLVGPVEDVSVRRARVRGVDGADLERSLVEQGLAVVTLGLPRTPHVDALRAAEQEARREQRGVWAGA